MRVLPVRAIGPVSRQMGWMRGLVRTRLERSTRSIRIGRGLQQRNWGARVEISNAFSTAPIT